MAAPDLIPLTHPGIVLSEEFLEPLGVTEYRLAKSIGVPQTRISEITHGRRRISADTALRLSKYLGLSEGYWTGLQEWYDRELAKEKLGDELSRIEPYNVA